VLAVLNDAPSPDAMTADFVLIELHAPDLEIVALVAVITLAFEAFGPNAIFADRMDEDPIVTGPPRPAVLEPKLVIFVRLVGAYIAGRLARTKENTARFDLPGLLDVALIIPQMPKPTVKALAVKKHDLFLRLDRFFGNTL
jgi:hypothetical protein